MVVERQIRKPRPFAGLRHGRRDYVPVGRPVKIDLKAADVIHSFWVPNLTGKQDLIPGQDNVLSFTARRAGRYRGQCAEFCGWQHAHMAFVVIAESEDDFEAWRVEQLKAANSTSRPRNRAGSPGRACLHDPRGCALCHTIRGTDAGGRTGPDLTHLASRRTLAAGTLPNTKQDLLAWIADPQSIKPGNKMPKVPLNRSELDALEIISARSSDEYGSGLSAIAADELARHPRR